MVIMWMLIGTVVLWLAGWLVLYQTFLKEHLEGTKILRLEAGGGGKQNPGTPPVLMVEWKLVEGLKPSDMVSGPIR